MRCVKTIKNLSKLDKEKNINIKVDRERTNDKYRK